MFAVVRHPDIDSLGVIPLAALESHRAKGWCRVTEWRNEPADFHLPDFDEATEDLDAPKPKKAPAKPGTDDKEQEA